MNYQNLNNIEGGCLMILDNIQVVDADRRAKPNEGLVTNSIKERKESYENLIMRTRKLIAQRDAAIYALEEKVINDVAANESKKAIEEKYFDAANKIENLNKEIYILGVMQGPIEKVADGRRAIRLIDKMIKNAKTNSQAIYKTLSANEPVENAEKQVAIEVPTGNVTENQIVNVEQIAANNQVNTMESIENAIEEQTLENADIDAVVSDSLNSVVLNKENNVMLEKQEEVTPDSIITDQELQEIVNEKMKDFTSDYSKTEPVEKSVAEENASVEKNPISVIEEKTSPIEEYEYTPMTDEEIENSRNKIEYALRDKTELIPERNNMNNDLYNDINNNLYKNDNENILDEPTPIYEPVPIVVEKIDSVKPVGTTASEDFIKKLENLSDEELDKELNFMASQKEQLEEEANNVEAAKEEGIRINSEVAAEEEEIEKKEAKIAEEEAAIEKENAELQAEDAREKAEVRKKKIAKLVGIRENIDTLTNKVQRDRDVLADVNKNTEARRENISNKNRSIENKRENISNITKGNEELKESINKSREMSVMLSGDNVLIEEHQKTM